jgi:hypothetical protein
MTCLDGGLRSRFLRASEGLLRHKNSLSNSATMPTIERLIIQGGGLRKVPLQVRYGLILHPVIGLALIATETVQGPRSWPLRLYSKLLRPILQGAGQPVEVLNRFDLTPADIQQVIITHFHAGHISGLRQLVNARSSRTGRQCRRSLRIVLSGTIGMGCFPNYCPMTLISALLVCVRRRFSLPRCVCLQVLMS